MNVDPEDDDDFAADERVLLCAEDPDDCVLVRGASILLTTLAALLPLFVFDVRELFSVTRADRDGVISRETREDRFELEGDETLLREEREEAERLVELLEATSTVRFTGRERLTLLRVERVDVVRDGVGLAAGAGLAWVDRVERDCEGDRVFEKCERVEFETVGVLDLEARDTVRFCVREDRDTLGADGADGRGLEAGRLLRFELDLDAGAEGRVAGADRRDAGA